jgi:hypothetical protein
MIPSRPIIIVFAIRRKLGGTRGIVVMGYEPGWQLINPTGPVSTHPDKGIPVR